METQANMFSTYGRSNTAYLEDWIQATFPQKGQTSDSQGKIILKKRGMYCKYSCLKFDIQSHRFSK